MPERVVPDTENQIVATLAVAWEIVKVTYGRDLTTGETDANMVKLTNAVIKSYKALLKGEPIPDK